MDLTDPSWWITNFSAEWAVVAGAPALFLLAIFIVGVPGFVVLRAHYRERIETLSASVAQKQGVIDDYKDKLGGGSPGDISSLVADLRGSVAEIQRIVNAPQRRLNGPAKTLFVERLRSAESLRSFRVIVGYAPDRESTRYASSLGAALEEAGINWRLEVGRHDEGEVGLFLYLPSSGERSPQAASLAEALAAAGIPFTETADQANPPGSPCYLHVAPEYA
ncbi:MAG: hypothetical protein CFE28_15260 [Alphaproteobacteria bacterium PA2]|nr:MAG: hypothetical protein CFE28_15260 [Alphaproteobacteria bacterium PA2]